MSTYTMPCILCGAEHGFDVSPGEPAITSGPADNWYPGSGPEVDWLKIGCECGDHPAVNNVKYCEMMDEAALEHARAEWDDARVSRYDTHPRV
jgi:hypothetical protein